MHPHWLSPLVLWRLHCPLRGVDSGSNECSISVRSYSVTGKGAATPNRRSVPLVTSAVSGAFHSAAAFSFPLNIETFHPK